jgi:2-polyprenyl-3-methyl-5-hydroxy-6-metoxy-1,4-benzoquinol methylase
VSDREAAILRVWHGHVEPWARAVREGRIASRRLVTDAAIVAAVRARSPRSAIDLGCGEGWLVRALATQGIDVLGVDAVPALVQAAEQAGDGCFVAMDYAQVAAGALEARADVAICNFSLLGGESVDALLCAVPRLLLPGGALLIQTLHPWSACGDAPYRDGWREGSWAGCGEGFGEAAPWYFRTFTGWMRSFAAAGLVLEWMCEPVHPQSGQPASVIFVLVPR